MRSATAKATGSTTENAVFGLLARLAGRETRQKGNDTSNACYPGIL